VTYNAPQQAVNYLACNAASTAEDNYCKMNGFTSCCCSTSSGRRRLLFGGLNYLRSQCSCAFSCLTG